MTDDPRDILKAAGVDVADFDLVDAGLLPHRIVDKRDDCPQCALARIARLVADGARYKWQRDECADELGRKLVVDYKYDPTTVFAAADVIVDLNRRWDERQP